MNGLAICCIHLTLYGWTVQSLQMLFMPKELHSTSAGGLLMVLLDQLQDPFEIKELCTVATKEFTALTLSE